MVLTEDQVKILVKDDKEDKWIKEAREQSKLLKMHYYGTGLTEYLTKIQSLENDTQVNLRRKYAISNEALISSLLRPVDNAWSAKGGLINVDASDSQKDQINEAVQDTEHHRTVKDYLKNIWFDRFLTDPNGLLFMEVKKDGSKTYPVYKSIFDINKMRVKGIYPEYIKFEADVTIADDIEFKDPEKVRKYYWVVDDAYYYRVLKAFNTVEIVEQIPNSFGCVPAIQNSPIFNTETRIKVSPIHKQLGLLESYLIDNSINNIYKKLHGFPVFWFYTGKCESCKGTGHIDGETCQDCNGSKQSMKRDVSDGIPLATPADADAPTIAPDIAGYIQPALETWTQQREELEHLTNLLYFSMWGTTVERIENETATGRFIDAQPVMNRLEEFSDIFEVIHKSVLELYSKFYFPTSDIGIHVSYGRRYLIETPDQLWKKYTDTLANGADDSSKDLQLSQYYEAEFQSDELMKDYFLKLMKIEPLVHYNVEDVLKMNVDQEIKNMKVAFTDWKHTITPMEVVDKDRESLVNDLKQFTDDKFQQDPEMETVETREGEPEQPEQSGGENQND